MKYLFLATFLSVTVAKANLSIAFIEPKTSRSSKAMLEASALKVYDIRAYQGKIAFVPDMTQPTCLFISGSLDGWLQSSLDQIPLQLKTNRKIHIVIHDFWFETIVSKSSSSSTPKPQLKLSYQFDIFSQTLNGIFAAKRVKGNLTRKFENMDSYALLCTKIAELITNSLLSINFNEREMEKSMVHQDAFANYLIKSAVDRQVQQEKRGMYYSLGDVQTGHIQEDLPEPVILYKTLSGKPLVTRLPIKKSTTTDFPFAYSDGLYLFLHTNNGYYIRLERINNGFLFTDMYDLAMLRRKHFDRLAIEVGQTKMEDIRNFAKVYRIFYMLDMKTGRLM